MKLSTLSLLLLTMATAQADVKTAEFGKLEDGTPVQIFTLKNASGMEAKVTEYGAILVSLTAADSEGKFADVTLGYDDLPGWLSNTSYFGATAGRFANRIAAGKFSIGDKEYTLATNNEPGDMPCALHGGLKGFDKVLWKGTVLEGENGVSLKYTSADGEEGYPGNLSVEVKYILNDKDELIWDCSATTDAPTVLNIVHHSYWNLSGDATKPITNHKLTLFAEEFLPTNKGLIPTGAKAKVEGTPMDFRKPTKIGERIGDEFEALELGGGYDHCWVLGSEQKRGLNRAALLIDPRSGRKMEILTDQPGVQFYSGNFLDGTVTGKGGVVYEHRTGLCLETENFPDAPNQKNFPSALLEPGQTYRHTMVHRFFARAKKEEAK